MKVTIKEFNVDMEVKNSGVEFDVYSPDGSTHHGDLVLTKSGIVWCKGRTKRENGISLNWTRFIELIEAQK